MAERFWKFVAKGDGCWLWQGSDDGDDGYGRIKYGNVNIGAHRASWIIHFGEIPPGMQVCHHCDNPPCVNPEHLFLGTSGDNTRDMVRKNRHRPPRFRGETSPLARLNNDIVRRIRMAKASGVHVSTLAQQFNIAVSTVYSITNRSRWAHL